MEDAREDILRFRFEEMIVFSCRVPESLKARLEDHARKAWVTVSEFVRGALAAALEKEGRDPQPR